MKLNLTVEEAIYILNRLKGREINDMAELMFKMHNTEKLVLKIKKQINKELLKNGSINHLVGLSVLLRI